MNQSGQRATYLLICVSSLGYTLYIHDKAAYYYNTLWHDVPTELSRVVWENDWSIHSFRGDKKRVRGRFSRLLL